MRVISSGIEALVTARQLDEKIASKKIPILASSSSHPDFLDPSVTISGGAILKQRIFGLTDPKFPAPMLGKAECGTSMPETSFLTRDDRRLLGEVYEWARDQGADLFYVDDLAFGLASYREKDDGRIWSRHNEGKTYDMEGHKVFYSFTDTNAATAKRIIEGSALTTTRLDQGFIRFITDKDYGALGHNHFEFMEKVINRFSTSGERDQQLGPDYATYKSQKNDYIRLCQRKSTPLARVTFGKPASPLKKPQNPRKSPWKACEKTCATRS